MKDGSDDEQLQHETVERGREIQGIDVHLEANWDSGVWPQACMVQLILGRHVVPRPSILADVCTGVLACLGVSWLFLGRLASTDPARHWRGVPG